MSLFLLTCVLQAFAQRTYTGTVTDKGSNTPLPGVSVAVKGTTNGTITNLQGNFTLNADENATLIFSFIGYKAQEVASGSNTEINVSLEEDVQALEEVVVVGYGTQRITKVSGAISTIKSIDVEKQKPLRVEEALQGRASGVSVIQGGSPGSKPTVLIRGIPSFSGTDPVVIIDGIPQTLSDLNAINSSDIESFNVLKDAASTAIYGVKGGNGVIVVSTKNGKKNQKAEISFSTYFGQQQVIKQIGVLNATEYAAMINEGSVTSGGQIIFPDLSIIGVGTNWQDQVFKSANISSHNLTVAGGGERTNYFISAGFMGQDGIVGGGDKSNFKRANFTANTTFEVTKNIKLILNTSYVNIRSMGVSTDAFNSVIGAALNFDPTVTIDNAVPNTTGKYGFSNLILSEVRNPLTILDNTHNQSIGNKLFGKAELQFDITSDLKVTSRLGYIKWDQTGKDFNPLAFYGPLNVENTMNADGTTVTGKHNSVSEYGNSNFSSTFETYGNYNLKLGNHQIETVFGFSMSKSTSSGFNVSRQDVPFNSWDFASISSATGVNDATNTSAQMGSTYMGLTRRNLSYFGRANYDYKDKYLASVSLRRDGSMAFGANNKFANFFAGSVGWVVTHEDFFKVDFVNNLKIRGSLGSIGNENVNPQYVAIVTGGPSYSVTSVNSNGYTFGNTFVPGSTVNSFKNDNLSWEKQVQMNFGIDMVVLKNKISLTADYFQKKVDGLLFKNAAPLYAGTSEPVDANIGSTKSSGFDITLGYNDTFFGGLKFNTSITYTTSTNLVTATNNDGTAFYQGGGYFNGQSQLVTRFQKDYTPGYFYGFKTNGLFQSVEEIAASPKQDGAVPGDIKYVDINGDGKITNLDKTKIGDPFPKFTIGWNLGLEYKNFYVSMFTYVSYGNDIFRAYERNGNYTNKFRNVLDRWTGPNTTNDANNPRYSFTDANSNIRASDRYVEDGSFIKIKSLTIGYTIPSTLYKNKIFSKINVFAQARNLYTFTNYSGYDPEISGGILETGVDRGAYPQARTYSIGLDLKF